MAQEIILLSSTQYPGYGGAATNTYALIKHLKNLGYNVFGIFFENIDIDVDPDGLGNIIRIDRNIFENNNLVQIEMYRIILKEMLTKDPDIMLCKNYKAPIYCSMLFPSAKNIYLVSGITSVSLFYPGKSSQYLLNNDIEIPDFSAEIKTMEISDLVVANSLISLKLLHKIYPNYIEKIYPYPIDTTKC